MQPLYSYIPALVWRQAGATVRAGQPLRLVMNVRSNVRTFLPYPGPGTGIGYECAQHMRMRTVMQAQQEKVAIFLENERAIKFEVCKFSILVQEK